LNESEKLQLVRNSKKGMKEINGIHRTSERQREAAKEKEHV
jgi:hypothetical protein